MHQHNKNIQILIIKHNKTKLIPESSQTKNLHDNTNQKIRLLGNKYFHVKSLFDKLNLQRDTIFDLGRIFEEQYKNKKNIIHLPTSSKRMKDAILCWFASNFYEEIFTPGSNVFNQLLEMSIQQHKSSFNVKSIKKPSIKKQCFKRKPQDEIQNREIHRISENANTNQRNTLENSQHFSIFNNIKMNEEIDNFQCRNDDKPKFQPNYVFDLNQDLFEMLQ